LAELCRRPWTGNVRELRNAIEYAAIVARGDRIRPEHLPAATKKPAPSLEPHTDRDDIQERMAAWARRAFREPGPHAPPALYERFLELAEPPMLRAIFEDCGRN